MVLRPVFEPAIIVLIMILGLGMVGWGWLRATRRRPLDVVRRGLMVVLVAIMATGPSIPGEAREIVSATEVWLVVDRTGSMAAEDWDGKSPRIDGVRKDVKTIVEAMAGSKFTIMTWDSDVRTVLPLTTDLMAVDSYMKTFSQELSENSQGSSPDRPALGLAQALERSERNHPENIRAVFIFTDGETSNSDHWTATTDAQESDWNAVAPYVDGGLVIGYGTEQGGPMKVKRLGPADASDSSQSAGGAADEDEYIRDESLPGSPIAISKIDAEKLQAIAGRLAVSYVHSPDTSAIDGYGRDLMSRADVISKARDALATYRVIMWPFALALGALLAWEGGVLAARARVLRRAHAI
nr:vWA domain-containing protein [Schaalia vaccimaxillae]